VSGREDALPAYKRATSEEDGPVRSDDAKVTNPIPGIRLRIRDPLSVISANDIL